MVGRVPQVSFLVKAAGFLTERLPARAGKTSKRKLKRTVSEHKSFRNCRIYRRSRDGWREKINRGRAKRFTCKTAAPPPPFGTSGGGGGAFVGITYNRQAQSFPHYGKLFAEFSTVWKLFLRFFHSMENFLRFFPRYGKFSASFPRYGKLFSTPWKTG